MLTRILVVALIGLAGIVAIVFSVQRHSFTYALEHAKLVAVTLPDGKTYYLSDAEHKVEFEGLRSAKLTLVGDSPSDPRFSPSCRIVVFVGGAQSVSDHYAIAHCRQVLATYFPRDGLIGYGNEWYAVRTPFNRWVRSMVPSVNDYIRTPLGPNKQSTQRSEHSSQQGKIRIQSSPAPLP